MTEAPGDAGPRSAGLRPVARTRPGRHQGVRRRRPGAHPVSDVARKTGLTRAAARRFLHTLAELGYVRSDGRLLLPAARGPRARLRLPVRALACPRSPSRTWRS